MVNVNNPVLSVVIPCKNEEANIQRCLESIIKNVSPVGKVEIILVDSFSNDKTIDLAAQYPIRILQLKENWLHSAAAARYMGCLNARGKYIFIIDADMELIGGFLEKAIAFMEKDQKVAAIAGISKEVHVVNAKQIKRIDNLYNRNTTEISDADYLGGAALFRCSSLEEVGSFNPYLYSQEELELCQRLKRRWKIITLPYLMNVHYTYPYKSIVLFNKHLGSNRFTGMGQLLRLSFGGQFFWANLRRFRKFVFVLMLVMFVAVTVPILIIMQNSFLLKFEMFFIVLFYLLFAISKRSFKQAVVAVTTVWPYIIYTFLKGLFLKPKQAQDYPKDVIIIKG